MTKIKAEILKFIVAGFSAVFTDSLVYFLLIRYLNESFSKAISFISGTIVAFIINKFWTFNKPNYSLREIFKFAVLYSSTLIVNVSVNFLVLSVLPSWRIFAFLCATGASTVLNFLGQKFWVFK
jgi:putative flippase GtrA